MRFSFAPRLGLPEIEAQRMSRILRLPAACERTGLSRTTVYRLIARGDFPAPVRLSARAIGFDEAAVTRWIAERVAASAGVAG